jgi:hypothetical protein
MITAYTRFDSDVNGDGETLRYYHDGANVLMEYDGSQTPVLQRYYVHGTGYVDERAVMYDAASEGEYAWVVHGSSSPRSGPGQELYFTRNVSYFDLAPFKTLAVDFTPEAWVRFDDSAKYGDHSFGIVYDIGKTGR